MAYRPYIRKVENLFQTGEITWDSPVNALPYIGNGLTEKLQNQNVFRLRDVVNEVEDAIDNAPLNAAPDEVIFNTVAGWLTNVRAHTCVEGRYLPRPVNRMGFNVLIDLLAVANSPNIPITPNQLLERGICQWNENHNGMAADGLQAGRPLCNKVPQYGNVGAENAARAMRTCPCRNENQCNGPCVWVPGIGNQAGACLSRVSSPQRRNYARDARPFTGDWQPNVRPVRPNTRRVTAPPGENGWWYALGPEVPEPEEEEIQLGGADEEEEEEEEEEEPRRRQRREPLRRSGRIARRNPRRSGRKK